MSKRWKKGSTRAWRQTRALVLARDSYRCRLSLSGCTSKADHVHHTVAREVAGDDPSHLIAACRSCNLKAGDPSKADPAPQPRAWW
ncbi:hypothetical protein GCM10010472_10740 [Pseudonocardia halophobica]|uniref:HNH nuclease domain-containing protein n=1 Tax=Pseudonocardia halophobica TaxID=29401 RepID=A0A9W6L7P7_9PSEU|nr:hypothetical protein GCM10017577_46050 [Pseudonocardia halophobica]